MLYSSLSIRIAMVNEEFMEKSGSDPRILYPDYDPDRHQIQWIVPWPRPTL